MRHAFVIALMIAGPLGCAYANAQVIRSNVEGPHGESLFEVGCFQLSDCYRVARNECGGDFDVVTNGTEIIGGGREIGSIQEMMVSCRPRAEAQAVSSVDIPGACSLDSQCSAQQFCYVGIGNSGLCMDRPSKD
jgi:hypothetical protein